MRDGECCATPARNPTSERKPIVVGVRVFGELRKRFGGASLRLEMAEGATADEVIGLLERRHHSGTASTALPVVAFLNGRNVDALSDGECRLRNGDVLVLTYPIGGG